jgi:hypothetical protein
VFVIKGFGVAGWLIAALLCMFLWLETKRSLNGFLRNNYILKENITKLLALL